MLKYKYLQSRIPCRCSGGHGLGPGPGGVGRAVIAGDLVQSRDFHYSVEPAPVYRRPREVAYHTQAQVNNAIAAHHQELKIRRVY